MNKKVLQIIAFTSFTISFFFGILFVTPSNFVFAEDLASKITSINPTSAYFNQEVDIVGTGFGNRTVIGDGLSTDSGAGVSIDGQFQGKGFLISWTDTKIRIRIHDPSLDKYNSTRLGQEVPLVVSIPEQENSNSVPIILLGACNEWQCGDFGQCQPNGIKTRTCTKNLSCPTVNTASPSTSQSCTPPPVYQPPQPQQPTCDADTWICGDWNSCSLSGVQSRSCRKTFDCPNVQTAPPITDQYCEPTNRPIPQTPPSGTDEILNQDSIIKSTVKLLCPVNAQMASQGSGTIIDPSGIILTNKHVIAGTLGCFVGFINDFNDEPYFGERQIADTFKISSNQDIAILKIRNPQNRQLTSIDITKGNSNLRLGTKITIYGYPAKFGTNITYTSGDFSGTDGSYLKTTAILEYGNSGGGAYLKDGTFIGIPSAVVKGELNALGYILSINTINAWLGNSSIISSGTSNNYSRVSVLEDMDLKKLGSLKLFIPDTDAKGDLSTSTINQNSKNTKEQLQPSQTQKELNIIESTTTNQKINPEQSPVSPEKEQKVSLIKRFFFWITKLFK